jgi:hypothetical protein
MIRTNNSSRDKQSGRFPRRWGNIAGRPARFTMTGADHLAHITTVGRTPGLRSDAKVCRLRPALPSLAGPSRRERTRVQQEDLYEDRLAGPVAATGIAAADPEHVRQGRGHVEAKYNPRGEKKKKHRAASLYQSTFSILMTIPESLDGELSQNSNRGNNHEHHRWRLSFAHHCGLGPARMSGPDEGSALFLP